jgi:hypothetical protein
MKRAISRLRVLSLFIAVLAINIHMILPHDHHLAEVCSEQDNSCPVSKSTSGHHTGLPVHCHACNDLASEKAVSLVILKHTLNNYTSGNSAFVIDSAPDFSVTAYFEINNIYSDSESQDITSLRAPPVTV